MTQRDEQVTRKIQLDLKRSKIGNREFLVDIDSGQNELFNVLNAYAMLDTKIKYAQGMNIIAAFIIAAIPE